MERQKYPVGQQNFENLRKDGYVYVDKTALIYDLVNYSKYIFLARPRRFGKSLLLSTIRAYFEGKRELFEGLAIHDLDKEWRRYPVLHLELSRAQNMSPDSLAFQLDDQFSEWEEQYEVNRISPDLSARFSNIIKKACKETGERVVILVDEYDNPLINSIHDSEIHGEIKDILKSVYSNLKALDEFIMFGMLTGVSRFAHLSIFSGLNNLKDISFEERFGSICGITEQELLENLNPGIEAMARAMGTDCDSVFAELKRNYDGYHFTENCPDIYNPFSLLNALQSEKIGSYWFFTGTPTFLMEELYRKRVDLSAYLNSDATASMLATSETGTRSPLALLYQTGYLTIKDYMPRFNSYRLGIPNREVEEGLMKNLVKAFQEYDEDQLMERLIKLVTAMEKGDAEEFVERLQSYFAGIPNNVTRNVSELYFENNIYIIMHLIGVYCETEYNTSKGRIDVVLKTGRYVYILELKLDDSAEAAMRQINERGYALRFRHEGKEIIKVGINFSSSSRTIDAWAIERE